MKQLRLDSLCLIWYTQFMRDRCIQIYFRTYYPLSGIDLPTVFYAHMQITLCLFCTRFLSFFLYLCRSLSVFLPQLPIGNNCGIAFYFAHFFFIFFCGLVTWAFVCRHLLPTLFRYHLCVGCSPTLFASVVCCVLQIEVVTV